MKWPGATVVIMAAGPSLCAEDCDLVRVWRDMDPIGRRVITINTSFLAAPWADVLYGCDFAWWEWFMKHPERWTVTSEAWSQDAQAAQKCGVEYFQSRRGDGLCKLPNVIHQGGNSGYQAIGLAVKWSVSRIVLLGYDMQNTGGQSHWHGDHPAGLQKVPPFATWISAFEKLAGDLRVAGVETINASRATALTCFRRQPLESALMVQRAWAA